MTIAVLINVLLAATVFMGVLTLLVAMCYAMAEPGTDPFNPPSRFPKGHIRAYDPDGLYTYADQNPRLRNGRA